MYTLNHSVVLDENGLKHDTYGITYGAKIIKDISTERQKIERLINLCNALDLSPIHIEDVIEDFLVDFEV